VDENESDAGYNTPYIPTRAESRGSYHSDQDSSSDNSRGSGSKDRRGKKKKSGHVKAAEISQAVNTAFQENMSSFRQDIESEFSSIRQEIEKLDDGETLQDMANSIRKLVTAGKENLACFDSISQLARNSSENVTTVAEISACQSKQNVKIDTNNSALLKLKH
jgi:Mg2+ and Co2+ transporter CorA